MKGLQPADWADLLDRLNTSDELFQDYMRYLFKMNGAGTFTPTTRATQLCAAVTTVPGDHSQCQKYLPKDMSLEELAVYSATHKQSMC